jgi:hypothetical protein
MDTKRQNQLNKFMHNVNEHFLAEPYYKCICDNHIYIYTNFLFTSVIIDINKFTKNCEKAWFVVALEGEYKLKISITI